MTRADHHDSRTGLAAFFTMAAMSSTASRPPTTRQPGRQRNSPCGHAQCPDRWLTPGSSVSGRAHLGYASDPDLAE